jgi:hypothetical protein
LAKSANLMMNNNKPMTDKDRIELREKILKGITLAAEKLIRSKQKTDGELVYSKDGKIVFIKAKDIVK